MVPTQLLRCCLFGGSFHNLFVRSGIYINTGISPSPIYPGTVRVSVRSISGLIILLSIYAVRSSLMSNVCT
jgi:hypothetical protein